MKKIILIAALLASVFCSSSQGSLIFSDNFDSETQGLNASLANWAVSDGTIDVIGTGFFNFLPGNGNYLDLDGSSGNAGKITSSSITFTLGQLYEFKFRLAGSQNAPSPFDTVTYNVGSLLPSTTIGYSSNVSFQTVSHFFVGDGGSHTIVFDHAGGDNMGLLLDNVSVSSVPEPSSLTLLGIVMSAVGFSSTYRRRRATA